MQLTLTIDLDNAAFEDNPEELPRILHDLASRVPDPPTPTSSPILIADSNGNTVGSCQILP